MMQGDSWEKQSSKGLYDIGWTPKEREGKEIRIELKASSESPAYRFQQIRHPRLSGAKKDYDLLLCLGVNAGSLEWWTIPSEDLEQLAETGAIVAEQVIITRHHGKRRPIWNNEYGFKDEGWFCTDAKARALLKPYACGSSDLLRDRILSLFSP